MNMTASMLDEMKAEFNLSYPLQHRKSLIRQTKHGLLKA